MIPNMLRIPAAWEDMFNGITCSLRNHVVQDAGLGHVDLTKGKRADLKGQPVDNLCQASCAPQH